MQMLRNYVAKNAIAMSMQDHAQCKIPSLRLQPLLRLPAL